jgi:hypothetical protein
LICCHLKKGNYFLSFHLLLWPVDNIFVGVIRHSLTSDWGREDFDFKVTCSMHYLNLSVSRLVVICTCKGVWVARISHYPLRQVFVKVLYRSFECAQRL